MQPAHRRQNLLRAGLPVVPAAGDHRPRRIGDAAGRAVRFVLHFAEMSIAMLLGMAVFGPVSLGLAAQGYTSMFDTMSIDTMAGMVVFMVAPVVLWMRARGWGWRDGAEMAIAMLVPWASVLALGYLALPKALSWLFTSGCTAMLLGMLAIMLYRRDRYTSGYSFFRWPDAAGPPAKGGVDSQQIGRDGPSGKPT